MNHNKKSLVAARSLTAVTLLLILLSMRAPLAGAAAIKVTTTADEIKESGDCSLREAITAANTDKAVDGCAAGQGADTISLPAGTYKLSLVGVGEDKNATGDLDISADLSLVGEGRGVTTIDGAGLDRVVHVSGGEVSIQGVTISGGGGAASGGGGLRLDGGRLTLIDCRITDNISGNATNYTYGGGIYATGSAEALTIAHSRIDHNTALWSGGGIYVGSASLILIESRVDDNTADRSGGILHGSEALIRNSQISGNVATSISTAFGSGANGGIGSYGPLTMINSTISGNSATDGAGGLSVEENSRLFNVTITGNAGNTDGDLSAYDAGGLEIQAFESVLVQNSIIAGNTSGNSSFNYPDCQGTIDSGDYNLIEDMNGCTLTGQTSHDLTGISPNLGPLANNGGPTKTHALLPLSAAADGGNPDGCRDDTGALLITDQRGYARPVNGDLLPAVTCDIGAFESLSPGAPTATATAPPTTTPTTGPSPTASAPHRAPRPRPLKAHPPRPRPPQRKGHPRPPRRQRQTDRHPRRRPRRRMALPPRRQRRLRTDHRPRPRIQRRPARHRRRLCRRTGFFYRLG